MIAAVERLLHLEQHSQLTYSHIRTVAEAFGKHPRTVRRWMDNARAHSGTYTPAGRHRFTLTPPMYDALARWRGNVTAAYRELAADGLLGDPPAPSLPTFHRVVCRDLDKGERASLSGGEKARRRYDVRGQRPRGFRNEAWEGDHVEASVWVNVNGEARKPWITWFIDCATCVTPGLAITPQTPNRESILAALRSAVLQDEPYGPFGGLPGLIRIDRGSDFLSRTVEDALRALNVHREDLPARRPDRKGTVEALNGAVKDMLFRGMPGYTDEPAVKGDKGGKVDHPVEDLMHYEAFVTRVLDWVHEWNHEHTIRELDNQTPAQAWEADLTPIYAIPAVALHTFTLRQPRSAPFTITNKGVNWNNRHYIDEWMHGHVNTKVHLRYMPNNPDDIELYDAITDRYLGPAYAADQATPEQSRRLTRAWRRKADELTRQRRRARRNSKERWAPTTQPEPPRLLDVKPQEEVLRQLHDLEGPDLAAEARPDFLPLPDPSPAWSQDSSLSDPEPSAAETEDFA
ncbi:Mu transposase C-terminal domain-containing protein [Streptomyces sp. MI02-7b]|uniref:Mu transposase C-terminal domain-containing protein n=1 Tax=Streptomyces sp. MI02-7b TaxID=462941 RepID=UPI0029B0C27F|nr:Mu transposase C-terminal domain-containing protein [Streptomyces sp. MI02-7b]MDX3077864.1 Mu transposase C-terminal domain-containing protein [Streptomyces sp. MI02-7b]